jgi:uncharacterized protein (DUF1778 family)
VSIRTAVRKQEKYLAVRCFTEEMETIRNAAKQAGVSMSEYVRTKLLADLQPIPSQSQAIPLSQSSSEQIFTATNHSAKETAARRSQIDSAAARKFGHEVGCACIECSRYRRMFGKPSANESVLRETQKRKAPK